MNVGRRISTATGFRPSKTSLGFLEPVGHARQRHFPRSMSVLGVGPVQSRVDFCEERTALLVNGIFNEMNKQKFSMAEEENLISLIKQHPALYNCKLKSYRDHVRKNDIWKTIANDLGRSDNDCKTRWKNIRDYYKKKRNEVMKASGTKSEISKIEFFQRNKHLEFLETTPVVERETLDSVEDYTNDDQKSEIMYDDETTTSEGTSPIDESNTTDIKIVEEFKHSIKESAEEKTETQTRKKFCMCNENSLAEELKKHNEERTTFIKELLMPVPQTSLLDPAISMFFHSIASTVNKFTPRLQARTKVEIMNIVGQLEVENITEQQNSNST